MIKFKTIEIKNFFAVGDNPLTYNFEKSPNVVLVSGENGSGKSVFLVDSLCWVLFNKLYRKNVKKPTIVNNLNKKKCLVTVTFKVAGSEYKVIRGIKPNVFEIHKDGKLIDQSSAAKDYQKMLEENILRLSYDTFKQVVILSSSDFVPFMELSAPQRRALVEELLDIEIFSKMSGLLKEDTSEKKKLVHETDIDIMHLNSEIGTVEKTIEAITSDKDKQLQELQSELKKVQDDIKKVENEKDNADLDFDQADFDYRYTTNAAILNTQAIFIKESKRRMSEIMADMDQAQNNPNCPTCGKPFDKVSWKANIDALGQEGIEQSKKHYRAKQIYDHCIEKRSLLEAEREENNAKKIRLDDFKTRLNTYRTQEAMVSQQINRLEAEARDNKNVQDFESQLKKLQDHLKTQQEIFAIHSGAMKQHEVMAEWLKDTGIKSQVVKQYVPIINQRMNQYLNALNFFVKFEIDENFNETIRMRHREEQSYFSLSQGQKQRINLAMLFTWRDVAKSKNSVNTNLLILDETFDTSLDQAGTENLMRILDIIKADAKIFVISHKGELLQERIEHQLVFELKNNFTTMRTV